MDALALTVAALGGGVVATILNEWLRGRREYDGARLLVMAELATMRQLAQNVLDGRVTRDWFAAAGLHTAAWETYQIRLVRRLATNMATWGALSGVYATVDLFRANPAAGDVAGLQRSLDGAHAGLSALTVRPLWPPKHWFFRHSTAGYWPFRAWPTSGPNGLEPGHRAKPQTLRTCANSPC